MPDDLKEAFSSEEVITLNQLAHITITLLIS